MGILNTKCQVAFNKCANVGSLFPQFLSAGSRIETDKSVFFLTESHK